MSDDLQRLNKKYKVPSNQQNMAYTQIPANGNIFRGAPQVWPCHVSLRYLILMLLCVLIVTPITTHYYLSTLGVRDGTKESLQVNEMDIELGSHYGNIGGRYKIDHTQEITGSRVADLKFQIEELRRIKASVNQELRDLEEKRNKLHGEVSGYSIHIQQLQSEYEKTHTELQQLKLNIENTKLEQNEVANRNLPDIKAPKRILPNNIMEHGGKVWQQGQHQRQSCTMYNCFDYSRCSLTSLFPVYFYSPEQHALPQGLKLDTFVRDSVNHAFGWTPHMTYDPQIACIYVVLIGDVSSGSKSLLQSNSIDQYLKGLPYWNGDGRNHIILHVSRRLQGNIQDPLQGVDIGRAMLARSFYSSSLSYRAGFDLVISPSLGISHGEVWSDLPMLTPARRKHWMSFQGEFVMPYNINSKSTRVDNNFTKRKVLYSTNATKQSLDQEKEELLLSQEHAIIQTAKHMQLSYPDLNFQFQFSCMYERVPGLYGEWGMCGPDSERQKLLEQSTFVLIMSPTNVSSVTNQRYTPTSTLHFQTRLYEALKYGAIPVILGGDLNTLPYNDMLDWRTAVLVLPRARVTELHYFIRSFTDMDILSLRRHGRLLWQSYLGSTRCIMDTLLTNVRTRLQIPAFPAREEPSPSVFNETFRPLVAVEVADMQSETDDVLGPVEAPFPSLTYRHNFTYSPWAFRGDTDPHRSYPTVPFEEVCPGEAKFLGSETGFRPIGGGAGGSGKEFGQAIGGNYPREQFTIVMLTYEREVVLLDSLQRLRGLPHLNKVLVIWNSPKPPEPDLRWPDISVPIHVIKAARNSLNNRFLPYDAIETEAILSIDDDAHLRHDEIMLGFRIWRENRDRIVGFPGRFHAWDLENKSWNYNSNYSCELSMVLTGAAFFHKYYTYMYSNVMPQAIRDKVDELLNCEDLAMNFLVSHITRKPPVKVTSRWTFRCPGCQSSLFQSDSHFQERHHCINFFTRVYGYMPLLNTQGRVDSVLFKTRIPHDKQKCFKFI